MKEGKGSMHLNISDTFLLRSPLLSSNALRQVSSTKDCEAVLQKYYSRDECMEALYLASPTLYRKALRFLKKEEIGAKAKQKLLQYLVRMSSRCTPFGSFAGICTGTFGSGSNIYMMRPDDHVLKFRPDMQLLCQLSQSLQSDDVNRENLKYSPNTGIYKLGEEYRYIEHSPASDSVRKYKLNGTPSNQYLEKILQAAAEYLDFNGLLDVLKECNIEESEARAYIHTLINNQVLVSDLEPTVSGKGFYNELKEQIGKQTSVISGVNLFHTIVQGVDSLDTKISRDRPAIIDSLLESTKATGLVLRDNAFIQADMQLMCRDCYLDIRIKDDLLAVTNALLRLSRTPRNPLMERFKERFVQRYGDMEVPLSLAMDVEAGPGYLPDDMLSGNDTLIEGLELPVKYPGSRKMEWGNIDSFLHMKHQHALMGHQFEIEISDAELDKLADPRHRIPHTISMLVRILNASGDQSRKHKLFFNSVGGSNAMRLAGRFAYLDRKLENCLKDLAKIEQQAYENTLLAEIIHLPEERTGNVLLRPVLYPYEIPFLAKPSTEPGFCLPIDDLQVKVSENKVWLRSKKLDRYILPRLSNAHNYSISKLSLYRFLCDLQSEDYTSNLSFSWGPLEEEYIFLPRVIYKDHILSAAMWNLTMKDVASLKKANDLGDFQKRLKAIREKYRIPREVVLVEFDNELWLDLDNCACCEILFHYLNRGNGLKLMEFLDTGEDGIVKSQEGGHANEFLFFLYQDNE